MTVTFTEEGPAPECRRSIRIGVGGLVYVYRGGDENADPAIPGCVEMGMSTFVKLANAALTWCDEEVSGE